MSDNKYLKLRGKRFSLRIAISRKLHPYTTKREIERSIKTDSFSLAVRVASMVRSDYKVFEVELIYFTATSPELTLEQIKAKVAEALSVKLADIDRIIAKEILGGSYSDSKELLSSYFSSTQLPPPSRPIDSSEDDTKLLSVATKEYLKDKALTVSDKTIKRYNLICEVLIELVSDKPVGSITRGELRKLKHALPNIPTNREKQSIYDGMTLKEIVNLPRNESVKYYSENTQRSRLIDLTSFFTWLKREGYIKENPAEGLSNGFTRICTQARRPFSQEEINRLFNPADYMVAVGTSMARFWVPLIALHSGARLEEIAQLHSKDIRREEGEWVISFDALSESDKAPTKKLKTEASKRVIPIHPHLIQLGLVAYHKLMLEKGEQRLFPELSNENANEAYGDVIGKWFRRYRLKDGKAPSKRTPFHAFRNTVSDSLKKLSVDGVMIKELVGHKHKDVTNATYSQAFSIAQKLDAVSRLDFRLELIKRLDK